MSLLDADEAARLPSGMKSINLDLGGHGTKALAIHTTALQNKIQACKIIYDLVNCMGVAYGKYTQQTVQVMQELFTYMFNTDVRKYSVLTVANSISTMET